MLNFGSLKPVLTALWLPPGGPLLLIFLACWLAQKHRRAAITLVLASSLSLWILACDATAYGLNRLLLTSYAPINQTALGQAQAIVVLGGGIEQFAPEYSSEELSDTAYKRLAYAALWVKRSGLPLLYTGGKGWAASNPQQHSEAEVAAQTLTRDFDMQLRWQESSSRDTGENALRTFETLSPLGIQRIALVTNDWHMQRSLHHFKQAGFEVIPAPMGYLQPPVNVPIDFLPTANGLRHSYWVLREWVGLLLT